MLFRSGLDLGNEGVEVEDVTYDNFKKALLAVAAMPTEAIEQKAQAAHKLVKEKYTLENYRETMYRYIKEIIKE